MKALSLIDLLRSEAIWGGFEAAPVKEFAEVYTIKVGFYSWRFDGHLRMGKGDEACHGQQVESGTFITKIR